MTFARRQSLAVVGAQATVADGAPRAAICYLDGTQQAQFALPDSGVVAGPADAQWQIDRKPG